MGFQTPELGKIYLGSCLSILKKWPDNFIQCIVTSPPYWGLRNYGTDHQIWGGKEDCQHVWETNKYYREGGSSESSQESFTEAGPENAKRLKETRWRENTVCSSCGAWRGELGNEPTPDMFVDHLVTIFREVRRVLRNDGTLWLNFGDSYAGNCSRTSTGRAGLGNKREGIYVKTGDGLKEKDLVGIPWMVAFALRKDGWYLRSDIIWAKPNPLPESVTDRPTKAHEYIFLMSKSERYFFDSIAVREEASSASLKRISQKNFDNQTGGPKDYANGVNQNRSMRKTLENFAKNPGRNIRTVWNIPVRPFSGAHFATFPAEIPEKCVRAGTSEKGCCSECGSPWKRVLQRQAGESKECPKTQSAHEARGGKGSPTGTVGKSGSGRSDSAVSTIGWEPTCEHDQMKTVPCVVYDPFFGAGTVGLVAERLGRSWLGTELKPEYCEIARNRISPEQSQMKLL